MQQGITGRLMMLVVFIAAVAAVAASVVVIKQSNHLDSLENRISAGSIDQVASLADDDSHNRHFSLVSQDQSRRVDGVLTPKKTGFLLGGDLGSIESTSTYQLWADTASGSISLGILGTDATQPSAFRLPRDATRIFISSELGSGSKTPSATSIVSGNIPTFS